MKNADISMVFLLTFNSCNEIYIICKRQILATMLDTYQFNTLVCNTIVSIIRLIFFANKIIRPLGPIEELEAGKWHRTNLTVPYICPIIERRFLYNYCEKYIYNSFDINIHFHDHSNFILE